MAQATAEIQEETKKHRFKSNVEKENAYKIKIKQKLKDKQKDELKKCFDAHWNNEIKSYTFPSNNKIPVEAYLNSNEISFDHLEGIYDEYYSLSADEKRIYRLEQAKEMNIRECLEFIGDLQFLVKDFNDIWQTKISKKDLLDATPVSLKNLLTTENPRQLNHLKILYQKAENINERREKDTEINEKIKNSKENENKEKTHDSQQAFLPYTFHDLLNLPPKKWLMEGVFGVRDLGMIYGPSGCGKTFVIIDMIMKLCSGVMWAGRFNVDHGLNVAYCAGEGISGLPSRFKAASKQYNIQSLPNFTFYKMVPQLHLESLTDNREKDSDIAAINIFIKEWKSRQLSKDSELLDVLIIDTLHAATVGADENSAKDMGKVLQACRTAIKELGCTVILVHHTNKTGSAERGSGSLRGGMDFMIEIEKLENRPDAIMSCSKLKDDEEWKSQSFELIQIEDCDSVGVLWKNPEEIKTSNHSTNDKNKLISEMERYAGKRFTCKSLSEVIDKGETYTRKLLSQLFETEKCKRDLTNPNKDPSSRNPWVYYVEKAQVG